MPHPHLESRPFALPRPWPEVLLNAARQPGCVLFDSARPGPRATHSYLSFEPALRLTCHGRSAELEGGGERQALQGDPFALLEQQVRALPGGTAGSRGFCGGWAGLLGFDLRVFVEQLAPAKAGGPAFPDLVAGFFPWVLALEHATNRCELRVLRGVPGSTDPDALAGRLQALLGAGPAPGGVELGAPVLSTSREQFLRQVATVKRHIYEGDIYQANLTREVVLPGHADPAALYARLRERNPAPYGGFLDCGQGRAVLSSSPELFLDVRGRAAETRPIKGTRRRDTDAAEDARLREELLASTKDRAELTMIVDLERNDLARVCRAGTVRVPSLAHVDSYARVHHLEATVTGTLRDDVGLAGLLRATFPGGSISGAPKKRALEIIHELEPVRRGPYTGSLFWQSGECLCANILIRTLLLEPGRVSFHVGGGIVADSDPAAEWDETCAKAAGLEAALCAEAAR